MTHPLMARLIDLVLPPRCGFCGDAGSVLCPGCIRDLPVNDTACTLCAAPLPEQGVCGACQARPPPFSRVVAPMRFAYPVDAAVRAFKFRHQETRLPSLVELLLSGLPGVPDDIDAVVAMPMHWRRRVQRGFNQAALLAGPVARELGVPLIGNIRKHRHTPPQSTLAGPARRNNLANAFRCRGLIAHDHVLIVDDVFTSGQSAKHLAHLLRSAGAQRVSVLVVARAGGQVRL